MILSMAIEQGSNEGEEGAERGQVDYIMTRLSCQNDDLEVI